MVKVYLTIDLKTGRALYADQYILIGTFDSTQHAATELGDMLRYYKVVTVTETKT